MKAKASRILLQIHKSPDSAGCWLWMGRLDIDGYGITCYHGHRWKVHRLIYAWFNKGLPQGLMICHRCHNPKCCNPAHLYAGTAQDNMRDRREREDEGPGVSTERAAYRQKQRTKTT